MARLRWLQKYVLLRALKVRYAARQQRYVLKGQSNVCSLFFACQRWYARFFTYA
jgi:hypothetical protein